MSCWRRTTVLRIPAILLGFEYWREWDAFLNEHEQEFDGQPGCFSPALCESCLWEDYEKWELGKRGRGPGDRLDMGLYPDRMESVPGPFLDYILEEIIPLPPEENTYHESDCTRPLEEEERIRYLPLYQELFPEFTSDKMKDVHYCRYEWYDGAEAPYFY